jgi:hypothetical protein
VIVAKGRFFTVTISEPVASVPGITDEQFSSTNEAIVKAVVLVGLTLLLQVPLPVPVTLPPLLLSVKVQFPAAVTVPDIEVLSPLQIVAG